LTAASLPRPRGNGREWGNAVRAASVDSQASRAHGHPLRAFGVSSGQDPDAASQERHRDGDSRSVPFAHSSGLAELLPDVARVQARRCRAARTAVPGVACALAGARPWSLRRRGQPRSALRIVSGRYGSLPKINRLQRWYRPEFIAIGDAAHAMSPMFGVGVNHGVQDAVATRQGHRGRPSHRNGPNRQVSGMQQRSPARTRSGGHRDGPARPRRRPRPGLAKPRAAAIRSYVAPAKRMGRTGCWSCSRLPPRTGRRLHHRDRPTHGRRRHRRPACRPVAADHLSPPAG
jgi:hypothetical protein